MKFALLLIASLFCTEFAKADVSQIVSTYGPDWIDGVQKKAEEKRPVQSTQAPRRGQWNAIPGVVPRELSNKAIPLSQWLPMCFLFDPTVSPAKANEKLQSMTAAYAACGISLVPFTFPIRSLPDDPEKVAAMARRACPLKSIFGVRGAVQVEASPALPGRMCQDPAAKGCSTLCSPVSVSMVSANSSADVGLHESMHSNCCGPLCVDKGQGSGLNAGLDMELAFLAEPTKKVYASTEDTYRAPTISEEGCLALRAGASANEFSHWFDPERRTYFSVSESTERLDLMAGESFFPKAFVTSLKPQLAEAILPPPRILSSPSAGSKTTEKLLAIARIETKPEAPRLDVPTSRLLNLGLANGSNKGQTFATETFDAPRRRLAARLSYSLGMAEEAVEKKGWKRRPPSEEIRIFDGFNASDLNKSSPQHFSE